ncbi:MAG: PEP-CTERM sorting domain-containing protein [Vitreoscilla sp.]
MRRPFIQVLAAAAACVAMSGARASAMTEIVVSDFRVEVSALAPRASPAVSFASLMGSTADSDSFFGDPVDDQHQSVASGQAFGTAATASSLGPFAGSAAAIEGNVFGDGALIRALAYAGDQVPQTGGDATVGLADGVSTASFTLAPWTLMTISARVDATASCTGASPFEMADSGVLMAIGDDQGTGPQWAYVALDAFALGASGPAADEETSFISLSYVNDSDVPIFGVFSGYVASLASSGSLLDPVPEPATAGLLLAGLAILGLQRRRR